jgi:hypothetical protein
MTHPLFVFSQAFEARTRTDGTVFWATKDGAPEWVSDIVHAAHGGALPCDWRYDKIADLALELSDVATFADFDAGQWADSVADVYTSDVLKWFSGVSYAVDAVDDAAVEWGMDAKGIVEQIMTGQAFMLHELACAIVSALQDQVDEYLAHADELAGADISA